MTGRELKDIYKDAGKDPKYVKILFVFSYRFLHCHASKLKDLFLKKLLPK